MKNNSKDKFAKIYELKSKLYIKLDDEIIVANYFYDLDCAAIIPRSLKIIKGICSLQEINKKSVRKLIGYIKKSNKWAELLDKKDFNFGDEVFDTRYDLRNNGAFCIDINTEASEGEKVKFAFANNDFNEPLNADAFISWFDEYWDVNEKAEIISKSIKEFNSFNLMDKKEFLSYIEYRDRDLDYPEYDEEKEKWLYVQNM